MDRIGPMCTRYDRIRMNGQIKTNVDVMDQIESNWTEKDENGPNKTNVYQIGPKWKKWPE